MNSDHAPTAELPPLDVTDAERAEAGRAYAGRPTSLIVTRETQDLLMRRMLEEFLCRERQLRASLQNAANLESELATARDLIATMRARIAELERTNTWVSDKRAMKHYRDRAEAAEAQLRAVSDELGTELEEGFFDDYGNSYIDKEHVTARDARISAIMNPGA